MALTFLSLQLNPTVGDISGNLDHLKKHYQQCLSDMPEVDLMITPEMFLSGYPTEDLVLKPAFMDDIEKALDQICALTKDQNTALLLGTPWRSEEGHIFNAALLIEKGAVQAVIKKTHLPNYGVFDEIRIFTPEMPEDIAPISFRGHNLGILICEDIWQDHAVEALSKYDIECLLVLNGSPYEIDKPEKRVEKMAKALKNLSCSGLYVNQISGQDELVFDGASFAMDAKGTVTFQAEAFAQTKFLSHFDGETLTTDQPSTPYPSKKQSIYQALMLGLRDYIDKNGFSGVVLGLSGGIDSALCAAIAVDTLGAERVTAIMMPSPYTSQESLDDAADIADRLGIAYHTINIGEGMQAFQGILGTHIDLEKADLTAQNIQSRLRGMLLMAWSNAKSPMVLSTGNKSELSVGYATIYGDMAGGFSLLKDVYKTTVFNLCVWRNETIPNGTLLDKKDIIPKNIIAKPPSAELKPDQRDDQSLPPYEVLDAILQGLIEEEKSVKELEQAGFDPAIVKRVWHLLDSAEYKRRQAPPGVKITDRSFGKERRYPITNRYRFSKV